MTDAVAMRRAATGTRAHGTFRSDLRIFAPQADDPDRRYTIYDPVSDLSYFLGANELSIAKLFDGTRSAADVAAYLAARYGSLSEAKLLTFERRLGQLGLLSLPGVDALRPRDPATGISYGPLKAALSIPVMRFAPEPVLDAVVRCAPWLCSSVFVYGGLLLIVAALVQVGWHAAEFTHDVASVYIGSWHWLLWHYPVVVASIAIHELGHALACRVYRVRITDFGIAIYLLLATGWARPLQRDWSALPRRARLVTIVMGPYASLLFVSAGIAVWSVAPRYGAIHTFGVVMTVSAAVALVPTLLPMFNGDTYLAITEFFRLPRLRQRAFRHARNQLLRLQDDEQASRSRRALYWATVLGTVGGWLCAWLWLASCVARVLPMLR
jgi:putative peptide zinc metalloprotease protein